MGRPKKNPLTSTELLTHSSVVDAPVDNVGPMYPTVLDPEIDDGRFQFAGTPQYNLPEPQYTKEWLAKWRPYWAEDHGGHIQWLISQLHYMFVTQQELPGYRMTNNVTPGNGSWDNRIFHPTRNTGTNVYLMKCPAAEYGRRKQHYEDISLDRLRHINDKDAPEFSHGLNPGMTNPTYRPKLDGEDAYSPQAETLTSRS